MTTMLLLAPYLAYGLLLIWAGHYLVSHGRMETFRMMSFIISGLLWFWGLFVGIGHAIGGIPVPPHLEWLLRMSMIGILPLAPPLIWWFAVGRRIAKKREARLAAEADAKAVKNLDV